MTLLTRRTVLAMSLSVAAVARAGVQWPKAAHSGVLLSAFEDRRGDQYVGGLSLYFRSVFGTRVPMRAHGCALDPSDPERAIFFARRPGTHAFELRLDTLSVRTLFTTPNGRHLAGHGTFCAKGERLFIPEHDYERARGILSVRDARTGTVLEELDTGGIDPHEIAWLPDRRRLLIANGGILTHPRSYRRKLNLSTMDPSLCELDTFTGQQQAQARLPDHRLSIRHLAVASSGAAVVGLQFEGSPSESPVGVAAVYRPGAGLDLLRAPEPLRASLGQYVSSVAVSEARDTIVAACPYAGVLACWSLSTGELRSVIRAQDAFGVSRLADGSIVASQRDGAALRLDEVRQTSQFLEFTSAASVRWDDHWVAVAQSRGHNRIQSS